MASSRLMSPVYSALPIIAASTGHAASRRKSSIEDRPPATSKRIGAGKPGMNSSNSRSAGRLGPDSGGVQVALSRRDIANATAHLHWHIGSAKNRLHGSLVAGLAITSAIQVDDMEASSASGLPTSRNCDRILIENGLASVVALLK